MRNLFLSLAVVFLFLFAKAQPSFVRDSLDAYVQRGLTDWHIPGVAVCIVKDGKAVVLKGYGMSEWGTNKQVDEATLFGIGSNTKAFTGTLAAMLDAEKKLSLDDKVQKAAAGLAAKEAGYDCHKSKNNCPANSTDRPLPASRLWLDGHCGKRRKSHCQLSASQRPLCHG